MDIDIIKNLYEIEPPESQKEHFGYVIYFCEQLNLKVISIDFFNTDYDIIVNFLAGDRIFKFCFLYSDNDNVPLVYLKEST